MKNILSSILLLLLIMSCGETPKNTSASRTLDDSTTTKNPLLGTWKVVSTLNLTTSEFEEESEDYYHVYSEDYHMILVTPDKRPKVSKYWDEMNHDEMRSQLPIGGGLLKYEIRGQAIYSYYVSAATADYEGKRVIDEFEFRGDTLVHRNDHYSDGQMREWKLIQIGN